MQLICDGLDLSDAVLKVSKAVATKTTNPILEGIKLVAEEDTLTLSATDTELSIEKKIKAEIKVEGTTIVPGRFFSEFIKKLSNEKIELELNDKNQLKIKYEDSESYIQCFLPDQYPGFNNVDSSEYFSISHNNFKNLINKSIFSVAVDDSRPILKGTLLEINAKEVKAVALDGYRLAIVTQSIASSTVNGGVVVPARSLSEISKLLDDGEDLVTVYIGNKYIMVDLGDTKVISRILEGDFLNYKQIIATDFATEITINKNQLTNSLERASLLSKVGQNNLVKFDIKENALVLTSNSEIGNIKENINITLNGKDLFIAFNARYFMEAFRTTNDEFVKIKFNSPSNPCVVVPSNGKEEYLYLILPVRII
ncbi:MAG: DNA polymerase III subunit beta [Clostridiales bacterium]|nr:DNA polymerase III subunit beta [Clostridiales bacterium]